MTTVYTAHRTKVTWELPQDVSRTQCSQLKVSFGPSSKEGHHHNTFVRLGMTTSILIDSRTPICQEAKPCRLFHFHWKEIKCFVPTLSEFVRVVTDIGIDLLRRKIMSPCDVFILLPSSSAMSMGLYAWTFPQFNSHMSYHFTYQNSQVPRSMNTLWSPSRNLLEFFNHWYKYHVFCSAYSGTSQCV